MRSIVKRIEDEQVGFVPKFRDGQQLQLFAGEQIDGAGGGGGGRILGITPIGSSVVGQRLQALEAPAGPAPSQGPRGKTPSELQAEYREAIEKHIRTFCFMQRYRPQRINAEVKRAMGGKPRDQFTIAELKQCLEFVRANYPLTEKDYRVATPGGVSPARTFRPRVSTQVKTHEGRIKD
jgi:hypothetical protein